MCQPDKHEFYGCAGGWTRQKKRYNSPYYSDEPNDKSTMIILQPAPDCPQDTTEPSNG